MRANLTYYYYYYYYYYYCYCLEVVERRRYLLTCTSNN